MEGRGGGAAGTLSRLQHPKVGMNPSTTPPPPGLLLRGSDGGGAGPNVGLWRASAGIHLVLMTSSCGFYRTINNMWLYFP